MKSCSRGVGTTALLAAVLTLPLCTAGRRFLVAPPQSNLAFGKDHLLCPNSQASNPDTCVSPGTRRVIFLLRNLSPPEPHTDPEQTEDLAGALPGAPPRSWPVANLQGESPPPLARLRC